MVSKDLRAVLVDLGMPDGRRAEVVLDGEV